MFLRRLFRKKCEEYEILNPFNTDVDFELLPLRVKVEILYNLCEFRLDAPDVLDELKNLEADSLRVQPIGYDSKKSAYWYFYGTRLYREDFPKSEKPIWQVVCFTITDWSQLAKKLENTKCKAEQTLYKTLKKNFIPELPRLFIEKETLARTRLLEAKRCSQEENILNREDFYTDVIREDIKRKEINRKRLERQSFELVDNYSESRYEMGKSKEKKHKQKDGISDRSVSSSTKSKDAKPVGRQTNNSLASATGQILIQQVSNPHKKKMKTSQVFSQSEEDLQTGLHKILDNVKDHDDAWPFIDPVEEEYAPNYYSIIRKPMDLQKMEERLESGHYKTFSKFKTDFQLIVNNCRLYNGVDNEYTEMVDNLLESFNRAVERYLDQVSSSDDEIAVEFPEVEKHKKKKHLENNHKSKKKPSMSTTPEKKKPQVLHESDVSEEEIKLHKKKKEKEKDKDEKKDKKDKMRTAKKDKEKEKENKKVKAEFEEKSSLKKGKKRKSDVLDDHKSKREERAAKIRKEEVKDPKSKNKKDERMKKIDKEKEKHKKSKELESKVNKKGHEIHSSKKHKDKRIDSKKSNIMPEKKIKKPNKKMKQSLSQSRSRGRSRSLSKSVDRWSSSPPPSWPASSPESQLDISPKKQQKSFFLKEDKDIKTKHKSKHDKWKDIFKDDKKDKEKDDLLLKPKDKHNTLRETIEKLKAKSDLNKLKVEKDMKVYDFPNEPKESKKEITNKKKKEAIVNKKKKLVKDLFEDENSTADSMQSDDKGNNKKAASNTNNAKKFDALSLATEQTLKDINKWLDDTPKFPEFSSASNSPSHFSSIDDFDSNTNKSSDLDKKKSDKSTPLRKDGVKDVAGISSTSNSNNGNSNSNAKKRPMNRDPTKLFRRKEVQRTIDRLQPGKSKGNLLTNVQNKDTKQDELFPLGPQSKIKDTKNSLIVKTDDSAPKLSLGSVLNSFGKHKFIDDEVKKDDEGDSDKISEDKTPLEENKDGVKCDDVKIDSPKLDNSPGTATPNLSAWFKAFGAPKVQPTTKKTEGVKEDKTAVDVIVDSKKEDARKVPLPDTSPNADSPLMHGQPTTRQRKVSTGSSMSERSSFSQDMDSPRVGIDERIGAYPAPYPSPLHKSPSGVSPSLRSPLPEVSPKATYPFNGQIRVGFYQDTVSTKSSPDKSCSPRDNPQSPYAQYSEHVYTPPTTQNANYSYNNPYYQTSNYSSSNPTPPYNSDSNTPSYYDTTKPLTDQYQAKNPNSPMGQQQPHSQQASPQMSQQTSPNIPSQASPIDMQHYQQPHSPVVINQHQQDAYTRQKQCQSPIQTPQTHQQQQQTAASQQEKFLYSASQLQQTPPQQQQQQQPHTPHQIDTGTGTYRPTIDYGRQQGPPNVEPFRNNEPKIQQPNNSYPVKKRAYSEIEQTASRPYDEVHNYPNREINVIGVQSNREPPKYIHQNIPEPRSLGTQLHAPQPAAQPHQSNPSANQFPPPNYNYQTETGHQYPPINIPSAGRSSLNAISTMNSLDETRKVDMSQYTNMGYTGPDVNLQLARNQHYKQPTTVANQSETIQQQPQRFVDSSALNITNYKSQTAQSTPVQSNEPVNSYKPEVTIPRPTYGSSAQLEIDQSMSLRGLTHIVDRYPNEESRMLGLQGNPPSSTYYSDKNIPSQHMFSSKAIATSTPSLPMFSQPNTIQPYGVQTHPNMYNRQITDLQVPTQNQTALSPQQQQQPPPVQPTPPEPKPKKKRITKAAKAAAAAAAAAQATQQAAAVATVNPPQTSEPTSAAGQGFQSYAGLKSSSSSIEPSAISLKTASVVPGSAFNFGPSTTGISIPPGLYGDKDSYPNFLEDFRSAPNYYMAAAAAAHHRATPENTEKTSGRVAAHQSSNSSSVPVPSTASYPFIGGPQGRPPSYPLAGVPGPFMPPHQAPLMDTSSPQYLQYLQAGVLHQGLLPPGAYASGYHPALSIRQPYDSMTRPPWL